MTTEEEFTKALVRNHEARRVGYDEIDGYKISTVWVPGLAQLLAGVAGQGTPPIIAGDPDDPLIRGYFETAVYHPSTDWVIVARVDTRDEAIAAHAAAIDLVKTQKPKGHALQAFEMSILGIVSNALKVEEN